MAPDPAVAVDLARRGAPAAPELALGPRTDPAHPGHLDPEGADPAAGTCAIRLKLLGQK